MANTAQTLPLRYANIYPDKGPGTRLIANRTDYSKSFDVLVGTGASQTRIPVNREVATKRSAFFRAATSTRWTPDPSKPVDLQEHEPEVFRSYIRCIYFAWFDLPPATATRETVDKCYEALTKLYILTDKLVDVATGNFVLSKIIRLSVLRLNARRKQEDKRAEQHGEQFPNAAAITLAYDSTPATSPLRRLLRDFYLLDRAEFRTKGYPSDFVRDVLVGDHYVRQTDGSVSFAKTPLHDDLNRFVLVKWAAGVQGSYCEYHVHDAEHPRCVASRT